MDSSEQSVSLEMTFRDNSGFDFSRKNSIFCGKHYVWMSTRHNQLEIYFFLLWSKRSRGTSPFLGQYTNISFFFWHSAPWGAMHIVILSSQNSLLQIEETWMNPKVNSTFLLPGLNRKTWAFGGFYRIFRCRYQNYPDLDERTTTTKLLLFLVKVTFLGRVCFYKDVSHEVEDPEHVTNGDRNHN